MQRSTAGDHQNSAPLSPVSASGYMYPGQVPMGPGAPMSAPPSTARGFPTLAELLNALKRRMVLATFLGVLVGIAAGAAIWLAMPSGKHQVRALVQMKPNAPVIGKAGPDNDFESFKKTQEILLKTRALLTRVVGNAKVSRLPNIQTADDPVRYLEEQIRLRWDSPEILAVMMNGDDPPQLKAIVDTLLTEYLEDARSDEIKNREKKRQVMEGIKRDLDKRIEFSEGKIRNSQKFGAAITPEANASQSQLITQQLIQLNTDIAKIDQELRVLELQLLEEKGALARIEDMAVDSAEIERVIQQSETMREKLLLKNRKEAELKKLRSQLTPGAPSLAVAEVEAQQADAEYKAAAADLRPKAVEEIRTSKRKEFSSKIEITEEAIKKQKRNKTSSEEMRKKFEDKQAALNAGATEVKFEDEDLKPLKDQRNLINKELVELTITEKADNRISLREEAVVILNQNLRQKLLLAAAAAIAGGILIMLAVAFLEWRSRRVDSVDQVVNELGMRVIGTIPAFPSKASLKSGDASQSQNWRFVLNESVNSARTMLLHTAKAQSMQVIMVTSAMQGEGKTSLASQLGTSMATAGLRTLILDCDLRNPSMHKLFDAPLTPGCSEILCQEVDVSDAVQPTTVPNLWLIPAGQCSSRVISALAQGHPLETLFNRLRGQFDFIVVDSCPILPVADSLLVGQHVDGVVISILQDISQLPKVMTASEKLTQLNIPLLGAVVNGIKPDVHAYGYNYVKQLPA